VGPAFENLSQTLRGLRHRNFRLFFFGQLVSLVGSWMQNLAQGWLVWRLSHSPWLLGVVGFAQFGPILLLGLFGGVAADRFDRHRLVLATQTGLLVQAALLTFLTLGGMVEVWHVVVLAAVQGAVNAFDMPARQSFLVRMVGKEDLGNAIALNSSIFNGARIVGPALAGLVTGLWGEGVCFLLNTLSFGAVLGSLLAMRLAPEGNRRTDSGPWRQIGEGFRYAWTTPHVRALLTLVTATSLFALPYSILLPAVAGGVLHTDARGLGVLMSAAGLGSLAGALAMARRRGLRGLGRMAGIMSLLFGLGLLAFSLSTVFWLSAALLAAVGFFLMSQMAAVNTLLQGLVPDALRGRLISLYVVTFIGMAPLGSLVMGNLAGRLGVQAVLGGGGILTALAGGVFLSFLPRIRPHVRPLLEAAETPVEAFREPPPP
jgi:MFS family permease